MLQETTLSDYAATQSCELSSCPPPASASAVSLVQRATSRGIGLLETEHQFMMPNKTAKPSFDLLLMQMLFLAVLLGLVLLITQLVIRDKAHRDAENSHRTWTPPQQTGSTEARPRATTPRLNDEFKIPSKMANMNQPKTPAWGSGPPRPRPPSSYQPREGPITGQSPLHRSSSAPSQRQSHANIPRLELPVPKAAAISFPPAGMNLDDCPAWATLGTHSSLDSEEGTSYITTGPLSRPGTLVPGTGPMNFQPPSSFPSSFPGSAGLRPSIANQYEQHHPMVPSEASSIPGTPPTPAPAMNMQSFRQQQQPYLDVTSRPQPSQQMYVRQPLYRKGPAGNLTAGETPLPSHSINIQSNSIELDQPPPLMKPTGLAPPSSYVDSEVPPLMPNSRGRLSNPNPEPPVMLQWFPKSEPQSTPVAGSMGGSVLFASANPTRTRSISPVPSSHSFSRRDISSHSFNPLVDATFSFAPNSPTDAALRGPGGPATLRPAVNFQQKAELAKTASQEGLSGVNGIIHWFNLATPRAGFVPDDLNRTQAVRAPSPRRQLPTPPRAAREDQSLWSAILEPPPARRKDQLY